VLRALAEAGMPTLIVGEQGFLTDDGQFIGRVGALQLANDTGQLQVMHGNPKELFSEDLW
jgi:hypothetical protein